MTPKHGEQNYDKLYKLRPIINFIENSFAKYYQPQQKLVVDECKVKFKGRNSMKQYMRDKPVKRGFKIWMLCTQTGYNLKFKIYTEAKKELELKLGLVLRLF